MSLASITTLASCVRSHSKRRNRWVTVSPSALMRRTQLRPRYTIADVNGMDDGRLSASNTLPQSNVSRTRMSVRTHPSTNSTAFTASMQSLFASKYRRNANTSSGKRRLRAKKPLMRLVISRGDAGTP